MGIKCSTLLLCNMLTYGGEINFQQIKTCKFVISIICDVLVLENAMVLKVYTCVQ